MAAFKTKFHLGSAFLNVFLGGCIATSLATSVANAGAFPVAVSVAPTNTLPLTQAAIASAQHSLLLNVYLLTSTNVSSYIIDAINRGVHVEILLEGEPFGGIPPVENAPVSQIIAAMNAHPGNRFVEMVTPSNGTPRRFTYDHAKYMVIDNSLLLVGTDNYTNTSEPADPTTTKGDRGWEVLIQDAQPAQWFAQVFESDSNPSEPDIRNMLSYNSPSTPGGSTNAGGAATVLPQLPYNAIYTATAGALIVSPNNSTQGLVGLINSATRTLEIEQLEFPYYWHASATNPGTATTSPSPLVSAIVAAAQRGVQVRVLLNPDSFNSGTSSANSSANQPNTQTANLLNGIAQSQHLPIQVRLANLNAMNVQYIHNKGVIVDDNITLISSINWSQNAVQNNREAAVALSSPQVSAYYEAIFNQDWTQSAPN